MKFTKKEVCALIIGKSIGEMQRIVRQYNYKFVIDSYDGIHSDTPKITKNRIIHITIDKEVITKAV